MGSGLPSGVRVSLRPTLSPSARMATWGHAARGTWPITQGKWHVGLHVAAQRAGGDHTAGGRFVHLTLDLDLDPTGGTPTCARLGTVRPALPSVADSSR